jgi:hypothetical protein
MRDVEEGIRRSNNRYEFDFRSKFAVRVRDLSRGLLDNTPQIVHFSGHGAGKDGIVLETDDGESVLVGTEALANLFALHKKDVQCVPLNACLSTEQAEAIAQHIPFVIGMSSEVDDESAAAFALGFYDALGAGRSYDEAFLHGKNAIELRGLPGPELPVLLAKTRKKCPESSGPDTSSIPMQHDVAREASAELRHRSLIRELNSLGLKATDFVHCIGASKAVPFDQIYQPTKLLFRSGLNISASAAFETQNKAAQSIAMSRGQEFHSLTLESFLASPEDTIVFAGPGWGKTTFLHHIFRRKVGDRLTQTVLITLRRERAIEEMKELVTFWLSHELGANQKVLLLVDGYDELTLANRKLVSELLERFSASGKGRYILSCREHYHVISLVASHVRIDAFDQKDRYRFVTAFLAAQGSTVDPIKLVNELEDRQFSEFLSHPLLLALACIVNSGSNKEQPRSALRLLKRALFTLQHTWDLDRGISREVSTPPFMRSDRVERITRTALDKMQIAKVDPELVLQEIARFYGILVPSAEGWEFVHRTIQDYLAAQYWVDSGGFANRSQYEWDTRTAYAACLSGDATRALEGALVSPDGLTCAVEILSNTPDFDNQRLTTALLKFYSARGKVTVIEQTKSGIAAVLQDDLFVYFSQRFLNYLIESLAKKRRAISDALVGSCLAELRARRLRMDFSTFEEVKKSFPDLRFNSDLRIADS